jgi:hypothetical protein
MAAKYLHIVSFNVPYPPDYGGVIDIYYKIRALKEAGMQLILHCFTYGRQPSKELEELCLRVHYYPRKSGFRYFLRPVPYIVSTRTSKSMPESILGDSFPVLFEGLHSTALMDTCRRAGKKVLVRTHNIEHLYYRFLSRTEQHLFRKLFLRSESNKLARYEHILHRADHILCIAKHETEYFSQEYHNALFVPAFHRFDEVACLTGSGKYALFHGNLGVPENSHAFLDLAGKVLSHTTVPVIVAGKDPPASFLRSAAQYPNVTVISNPSDEKMDSLIQNAQVNLLYTAQSTGIKLKLLHALYAGRHCLVNRPMIEGTGLEHLCHAGGTPEETRQMLEGLMDKPFTEPQIGMRKKALAGYANRTSAEKIIRLLS